MGEPFFEPSLPSGLVCALGFFLETNRSASISSMSCAETDRGQRIGPQEPQRRTLSWVYHCFVSHLHVLQYVVGICCRHIRVLGWKGNYFSGHCNFPIKTQHRLFTRYLRLSSIPLDLFCQQTEDVIGGRCAARTRCKIQSLKS